MFLQNQTKVLKNKEKTGFIPANKKPRDKAGLLQYMRLLIVQGFRGVQGIFQQAGAGHRADAAWHRRDPAGAG